MLRWLQRISGIALALALAFSAWHSIDAWRQGSWVRVALATSAAPYGITSLTLADNVAHAQAITKEWIDGNRRAHAIYSIELDDVFVKRFRSTGILAALLVFLLLPHTTYRLTLLALALSALWLGASFDLSENQRLLNLLHRNDRDALIFAAFLESIRSDGQVKFLLLLGAWFTIFVAGLAAARRA